MFEIGNLFLAQTWPQLAFFIFQHGRENVTVEVAVGCSWLIGSRQPHVTMKVLPRLNTVASTTSVVVTQDITSSVMEA